MKKTESKAENKVDFIGGYKSKDKIKEKEESVSAKNAP